MHHVRNGLSFVLPVVAYVVGVSCEDQRMKKISIGIGFTTLGIGMVMTSAKWKNSRVLRIGTTCLGLMIACYGIYSVATKVLEMGAPNSSAQLRIDRCQYILKTTDFSSEFMDDLHSEIKGFSISCSESSELKVPILHPKTGKIILPEKGTHLLARLLLAINRLRFFWKGYQENSKCNFFETAEHYSKYAQYRALRDTFATLQMGKYASQDLQKEYGWNANWDEDTQYVRLREDPVIAKMYADQWAEDCGG